MHDSEIKGTSSIQFHSSLCYLVSSRFSLFALFLEINISRAISHEIMFVKLRVGMLLCPVLDPEPRG